MSMSNLIYINIHFMDMKRHMLICFFHWWIGKKNEIVRLQNEVVTSEIVFEMVHGLTIQRIPKNPP
jgi:hypothetical protein